MSDTRRGAARYSNATAPARAIPGRATAGLTPAPRRGVGVDRAPPQEPRVPKVLRPHLYFGGAHAGTGCAVSGSPGLLLAKRSGKPFTTSLATEYPSPPSIRARSLAAETRDAPCTSFRHWS